MLARAFVSLAVITGAPASAGLKIVASIQAPNVDVPSAGASDAFQVTLGSGSIQGFAITGLWTAPVADQSDGIAPWSLDFGVTVTAPDGSTATTPSPWFGDFTIADYPIADGFAGFGAGASPDGAWSIEFDSGNGAPWVAGLRNVTYHLLEETGSDVTTTYTGNTQQGNSWSRPFFIEGVSGLGPVDYHVLEFTVTESGVYAFESVLLSGGEHWSCLYIDSFDDTQPLVNLHDYGLGNGFSPFNTPRGTSSFDQVLFEGTTYYWVTSQWSSFASFSDFTNTIVGPGEIVGPSDPCNAADLAPPSGFLDLSDVNAFITAFLAGDPSADIAFPFGFIDLSDVDAFIADFLAGCP
ncbi:MAG: GC-type dockerin domain-anchored protein [Planctomycetota bacterium]